MPVTNLNPTQFTQLIKDVYTDASPIMSTFEADLARTLFNYWEAHDNPDTGIATLTAQQKAQLTDQMWNAAINNMFTKYFKTATGAQIPAATVQQMQNIVSPAGTNMLEAYVRQHFGMTKNQMREYIDKIGSLRPSNFMIYAKPLHDGHKKTCVFDMYERYTEADARVTALHDYTNQLQELFLTPELREIEPFENRAKTIELHNKLAQAIPFVP